MIPPVTRYPVESAAPALARQIRAAADALAAAVEAPPALTCQSGEHFRRLTSLVQDLSAAVAPLSARPQRPLVPTPSGVREKSPPGRRILYISGPFSDPDPLHGIDRNILLASEAALQGWRQGWIVFCPHKNTSGYQHVSDLPYEVWIEGDLEILRRCDAICMLQGWENSQGARKELALAEELDLEVLIYYGGQITNGFHCVRGDRP